MLCIQETKALREQVDTGVFEDLGYHHYWFSAQKKGYSGVAILTKKEPNKVVYGSGIDHMDFEGRILRVEFDEVSVMSLYLPSGTNVDRLDYKFKFMDEFQDYIEKLKKEIPNLVICGDYNICHEAIDIHDSCSQQNSFGFSSPRTKLARRVYEVGFYRFLSLFKFRTPSVQLVELSGQCPK